ncbi:OmpA family protein [uncultured Friedmanniella sp.]|uniref:OmpA family protein n=1 Tax=uncultured Friedmanniella sp. TaxID=335381 RepID=UPI0035CA4933
MTSPSARALRRGAATGVLALALFGGGPSAVVWADGTSSPGPTPTVGATATTLSGLSAPVHDIRRGPVYDIVVTTESIDGTETQKDTTTKRTVILDSKVLFPEDWATLSGAARSRLRSVAGQIKDSSATGTVQVDGYTDDQGSAQHGLVLSRQRAQAVKKVLTPLLVGTDVRIATRGLGEANPRFPNLDKAKRPIPANRAKNRRVEISFHPGR